MARFSIDPINDPLALCIPDPSTNPTRAMAIYLELDLDDNSLELTTYYSVDGTPMPAFHGTLRMYSVPECADVALLTHDINAGTLDALLSRIVDGAETYYDGSNYKATLSPDALNAEDELRNRLIEYIPFDNGGLWDAWDWFHLSTPAELGITATTTDSELLALANKLEAEARSDGAVLYDTNNALIAKRKELLCDD